MIASLSLRAPSLRRLVCAAEAPATNWACARRSYAKAPSRFTNVKKKRVEVLEKEPEATQQPFQGSTFQQQQQQQQMPFQQQSSSAFPSYSDQRERERQQGTQWDALTSGAVEHMRKVYATLATGIGISAGASLFAMATPLATIHPAIPGVAAIVPLLGIMYTNKHQHSQTMRAGLFAAFTGLSGVAMAPLLKMALFVNPVIVPQALMITCGLFGTMTALSLFAKPGATLRWGVPLGGGVIILMAAGLGSMFVPVTSAWYPLLHSLSMYGGLALFTAYVAYDTQNMVDEYEMGVDDHIKHAADLFINFKAIFTRVLMLLMGRSDD